MYYLILWSKQNYFLYLVELLDTSAKRLFRLYCPFFSWYSFLKSRCISIIFAGILYCRSKHGMIHEGGPAIIVAAAGSFVGDGTHGKSRDRVSLSVWLPLCGRSIPRNAHNAPFNMSRMLQRHNSILIRPDSPCTSPYAWICQLGTSMRKVGR